MEIKTVELAGLRIHHVTSEMLLQFIRKQVAERQRALILHLNIHGACLAFNNPWLRKFYNESHLVFCDGNGIRWGLAMLGQSVPPKIPITRWVWDLAAFCEKEKLKLFLLGATPEVAQKAADNLKAKHPGLELVGYQDGYFEKQGPQNEKVCQKIHDLRPDILVVGFGMPIQEKWLLENWAKLDVPVFLPGGGVLDYAAGRLGRAPKWMIDLHLEWLFRVYEEPQRLLKRYLTEIPYFFTVILGEALKKLFGANAKKHDGNCL